MIKKVCVFCASSSQASPIYIHEAYRLGQILAQSDITTVYGGGSIGSMGALADGVLSSNGKLIGVIPKFMMELEWGNPRVTEMIVVETMAERKKTFLHDIDAVIALPGGTGTLEELAETLSLKKLGLFTKPIIILNTNNFYNPLIGFIEQMVSDNFIRNEHLNLYSVANNPEEVLEKIRTAPEWTADSISIAAY